MNYQAFTDESLTMMYEAVRGALAADDSLEGLGEEPKFKVRDTPEWKAHAADLEAEMLKRGMPHVQQMLPHAAVLDTKHVDRARLYSSFHLIEQPIDAFWSAGARPVVAIARMASTSSRGAPARGGVVRPSSSRPRYLSLRSAL
jgi:hypothetical protein